MKSTNIALTNFDLIELAKKNNIHLDDVIMVDEVIQLKTNKDYNLIVNLQQTGQGGSHWIALITRGNKYLYIDSFGGYPHFIIVKHCLKHKFNLGYSAYICQDLKSQRCGYYCLKAIKYIQNSKANNLYDNANKYVNEYEPERLINEKIVMKHIIK